MDGHPFIHIILEIRLHAVDDLDLLPFSGGVIGIREGLDHTVVGDGDGGMPPTDGTLHHLFGVAQGVHHGHLGM